MHTNLSSNIRSVIRGTDRFSDQVPFAVASALTATVKQVQTAMPGMLEADLDRPTDFTKRGMYIVPARKDKLQATVGVKDTQAEYLLYQVQGGDRYPRKKALKLPAEALKGGLTTAGIKLDAHGNIRRTDLRRLINASKQARAGSRKSARSKSSDLGRSEGILYGTPKNRPGMPAGIYQRMRSGSRQNAGTQRRWLLPLVLFPQGVAKYRVKWDFYGQAKAITHREFEQQLATTWRRALATAR